MSYSDCRLSYYYLLMYKMIHSRSFVLMKCFYNHTCNLWHCLLQLCFFESNFFFLILLQDVIGCTQEMDFILWPRNDIEKIVCLLFSRWKESDEPFRPVQVFFSKCGVHSVKTPGIGPKLRKFFGICIVNQFYFMSCSPLFEYCDGRGERTWVTDLLRMRWS